MSISFHSNYFKLSDVAIIFDFTQHVLTFQWEEERLITSATISWTIGVVPNAMIMTVNISTFLASNVTDRLTRRSTIINFKFECILSYHMTHMYYFWMIQLTGSSILILDSSADNAYNLFDTNLLCQVRYDTIFVAHTLDRWKWIFIEYTNLYESNINSNHEKTNHTEQLTRIHSHHLAHGSLCSTTKMDYSFR